MTKAKKLTLLLIALVLILVIPNIVSAATELTYTDTAQGIEWSYELDSDDNVINLKCNTKTVTGTVTIPSTIDDKIVISLSGGSSYQDGGVFQECIGLTEVVIPETITEIPQCAFYGCQGLETMIMPDTISAIRNGAFKGCAGLTTITLSKNILTIGENAFSNCTGLTTITLPEKLVTIGEKAFNSCTGIKSIVIPNSVTTIEDEAFLNCTALEDVKLSEKLTKINDGIFYGCIGLTSIILPNSVTTIEEGDILLSGYIYGAFRNCTNLEKILIPDSVVTIGEEVFENCPKLVIYGNDGMKSKEYAEANNIKFDYIANWDKEKPGEDVTAPTIKKIEVEYESVMHHYSNKMYVVPTGTEIIIYSKFTEAINGTTTPTLTIKFGEGENIEITKGEIAGDLIIYKYIIKAEDKGIMKTVDFAGGDIKDATGNAAKLSCPELSIELDAVIGDYVYANGTVVESGEEEGTEDNKDAGTENGAGKNEGTASGSQVDKNTETNTDKDSTISQEKLPAAGLKIGIAMVLAIVLLAAIIMHSKYNKLKDIH